MDVDNLLAISSTFHMIEEVDIIILIYIAMIFVPEPQRGALPGRSPGRELLILRCESHKMRNIFDMFMLKIAI